MRNTAIEYRELFNSNGPIRLLYSVLVYNKANYYSYLTLFTYIPASTNVRTYVANTDSLAQPRPSRDLGSGDKLYRLLFPRQK